MTAPREDWHLSAEGVYCDRHGRHVHPVEILHAKRRLNNLESSIAAVVHELEVGDAGEGNLAAIAWCRDELKNALSAKG